MGGLCVVESPMISTTAAATGPGRLSGSSAGFTLLQRACEKRFDSISDRSCNFRIPRADACFVLCRLHIVNLSVLGRLDSESESNVRGKIASDDGHGEFGIEEGCMNECQVIPQLREEAGIIIAL
jgi:hypothetical protein